MQDSNGGDVGAVMYHIVYSNGTFYSIQLFKETGVTAIKKMRKVSLCSDCYTRDTGNLVANQANDHNCMEYRTGLAYDMHGGVFKPENAQGPQLMFKV